MRISAPIFKFCLIVVLIGSAISGYAGHFESSNFLQSVPGTPVPVGTTNTVALTPLTGGFATFTDYDIRDVISLKIPLDQYHNTEPFTLTTQVLVTPYNSANIPQTGDVETVTLTVNYNPYTGVTDYKDADSKLFTWHHPKFDYQLLSCTLSVNGGAAQYPTDLPDYLMIDATISSNRIYNFASVPNTIAFSTVPSGIDLDCDAASVPDEIEVNWSAVTGVEEYDLEWTYVNDYGTTFGVPLSSTLVKYDFGNSSRVRVTRGPYRISNIYDQGYIVFRIRPVGRDISNPSVVVVGDWSISSPSDPISGLTTLDYFYNAEAHVKKINWQVSTSFAEEGKKKEVVGYFDGANKGRETVTKTNTDNNAIVGQTIYDSYGRPAINVLPVPVVKDNSCTSPVAGENNPIKFYPKFNRNLSGEQYSASDFDYNGTFCPPLTPPAAAMNDQYGASNYYSPFNARNTEFRDLLPDALKYPFSQIEYTPDNTGRVRRQGSVGPQYQLNGKSSLYLYGQPNQIQLDRLFGPEVGDASHYKKNVVIDPNGQASVSYINMQGKTVATSLTGNKPDNMEWLMPNTPTFSLLTVDLLNRDANGVSQMNQLNAEHDALVFNSQILVPDQEVYTFNYSIDVASFHDDCMLNGVCFDCVYDLEIRVIDDCGVDRAAAANIFGAGSPAVAQVGAGVTYSGGIYNLNLNTTCVNQNPATIYNLTPSLVLNLEPGTYSIYKILRINNEARNYYLQQYLTSAVNSCYHTEDYYQTIQNAELDFTDCNVTCAACVASLGDRDLFVSSGQGTAEQFDLMVAECMVPCTPPDECHVSYLQMLADVSPGGQYAEYADASNGSVNPGIFPLSVMNTGNSLPGNMPGNIKTWRHPQNIDESNSSVTSNHYLDDDGSISKIEVFPIGGGQYTPAVAVGVIPLFDIGTGTFYVYPEQLLYEADFVNKWKPTWANALVGYHPEFCLHSLCRSYDQVPALYEKSSTDFDDMLVIANDATAAINAGLLDASGHANFSADPFLSVGVYGIYATALNYRLNHYQNIGAYSATMAEMAIFTTRAGTQYGNTFVISGPGDPILDFATLTPANKDIVWATLKSFYLSEKRKLKYDRYKKHFAEACMFNDCIGNEDFNWYTAGMWHWSPNWYTSPILHPELQPCAWSTAHLYYHKSKRYVWPQDAMNLGDQDDIELQTFYQTGQCPMAFHLQNFLSGLVSADGLDDTQNLQDVPSFSPALYEVIHGNINTPYVNYSYNAVTGPPNILHIQIKDNNNNVVCELELDKTALPSGTTWDDIGAITQLTPNGTTGGQHLFTASAQIIGTDVNGNMVTNIYPLTGYSTCFDIDGCTFPPQCDLNDFGRDVNSLLNALAVNNQFVATNVNLSTGYAPFITSQIANVLGVPLSSTFMYSGTAGATIDIKIWATTNVNKYIHLEVNTFDPATFNSFSSIRILDDFLPEFQNGFEFDARDLNQNLLAHAEGVSTLFNNGGVTMLPLGTCQVPSPLACQSTQHQIREDLETLLTSIDFSAYSSNWTTLNLTSSSNFTYLLDEYLPTPNTALNNEVEGNTEPDVLFLNFGDCIFTLQGDTDINGNPVHDITNLISILPPLTLTGEVDEEGNQYSFVASATFTGGQTGFVYGTTCLPMKTCDPCPWQAGSSTGVRLSGEIITPASSGNTALAYNKESYEALLSGFNRFFIDQNDNRRLKLDLFSTNQEFIESVSEKDFKGYVKYIQSCGERNANLKSAPKTILEWINAEKSGLTTSQSPSTKLGIPEVMSICPEEYAKYLDAITSYNASQWAITHGHSLSLTLFTDETDFSLQGYCSCARNYVEYLVTYINGQAGNTATPPVPITLFSTCKNNCETIYADYLNAVNAYNASAWAIANSHSISTTLFVDFDEFYNRGFCSCGRIYILTLQPYINGTADLNDPPPAVITEFSNCEPVNLETCNEAYLDYLTNIQAYNSSNWATSHGHSLSANLFIDFVDFYNQGLCFCVKNYVNYLQQYINNVVDPNAVNPVAINEWKGCGFQNVSECEANYNLYLQTIAAYNSSAFAIGSGHQLSNTIGSYADFTKLGYCSCVRLYIQMLQPFINGSVPVGSPVPQKIDSWEGCTPINEEDCKESYERYLDAIDSYNQSSWAIGNNIFLSNTLFTGVADFYNQGYCYCVKQYISYLTSYINGGIPANGPAPVAINEWEGCGHGSDDICNANYLSFIAAINAYNTSNWAITNGVFLSNTFSGYQEFYDKGFCSCVRLYINYLLAYTNGSIPLGDPAPVDIRDWTGCSPVYEVNCREEYDNYISAINHFNQSSWAIGNNFFLSANLFVDYVDFYNQGYCYCAKHYVSYLSNYINGGVPSNGPAPVAINQWEGCGHGNTDICNANYLSFVAAINAYNASNWAITNGVFLTNSFTGYQEFYDKGFCSCVRLYINYLLAYTNGSVPLGDPAPVDIRNWSGCVPIEPDPCITLYDQYVSLINDYNNSAYAVANNIFLPTNLFTGYLDFYNQGYCFCFEDYRDYLGPYISGTVPAGSLPPVTILQYEGCNQIIDQCVQLYNQYLSAITAYNNSSYAAYHQHNLPLNLYSSSSAFLNSGYCNCVQGYITYLNNYATGNIDPLASLPVTIIAWEGCNGEGDECEEFFATYQQTVVSYNSWAVTSGFPVIQNPVNYTYSEFVSEGLCNCAEGYVAYLNAAMDGYITLPQFNPLNLYIDEYCNEIEPEVLCDSVFPPVPLDGDTLVPEDPCNYQMQMNANMNTQILYNQQVSLLTSQFIERYNEHCAGAFENFTMNYNDREYHYTLYYYDQQGNLIKTVPPEGVELLRDANNNIITSYLNPTEQQVIADRTNNTQTVFTKHRLSSVYEYNSLNQLVRQSIPDHDKMDICEYTLPNGLDNRLQITSTRFIDASKGYLTGFILDAGLQRGYLYATYDAGITWTLVTDLLGAGINKLQMVTASVGYAVCESGVILKTLDGGNNWDILNTYANNVTTSLNDLYFTSATNGVVVGNNKVILRTANGGTTFTLVPITGACDFNAITFSGGRYYVAGTFDNAFSRKSGLIYTSPDAINWSLFADNKYASADINSVRWISSTTAVAAGDDGNVMFTNNSGSLWTEMNSGITNDIMDIYMKDFNNGVAIVKNGTQREIWRNDFSTEPASWNLLSNPSYSFNSLTPYDNSSNAKLIAVGNSGRVERVVMNAPPFGMINISPSGASGINFHAASAFYDGTKVFAAVAGNSNTIYYTLNATLPVVTWQTATLTGFTLAPGQYIKSIVLQVFNNTNKLAGTLLLSNGKLYDINASNYPTAITFLPCVPFTTPSAANQLFTSLSIVPQTLPNNAIENLDVYAFNNIAALRGMYKITLKDNTAFSSVVANAITATPTNYSTVSAPSFSVFANGNTRNILSGGTSSTAGAGGFTFVGSHVSGATTMTNAVAGQRPLPLYDITAKTATEVLATGANGTMLFSSNANTFKALENKVSSTINSALYYVNGANNRYVYATANGKLASGITTGYTTTNTFTGTDYTLWPASLPVINDIQSNGSGQAALVGNNGALLVTADLIPVVASFNAYTTTYSTLNFKGVSYIPLTSDLYTGSAQGKMLKLGTGYYVKVNAIHPPRLNDVHFYNGSNGYVVGERGFNRYSNSGATSWSVVLPYINGTNVYTANSVCMNSATSAIMAGPRTYVAKFTGTTMDYKFASNSYNANFKEVSFKGNNGIIIGQKTNVNSDIEYYKTVDNGATWYGSSALPYNFTTNPAVANPFEINLATAIDINAVHIFNNKRFIGVGSNKTIMYGSLTGNNNSIGQTFNTVTLPTVPTYTFNDVTFVDDFWGYIAGDDGLFWKTTGLFRADETVSNTQVSWAQNCGLSTTTGTGCTPVIADIDLKVVKFPSRLDGFLGGALGSGACATTLPRYAVLLHDESKLYSSRFWYDKLGRMVLSQNAKQYNYPLKAVSYTQYDYLGRIKEVGEKYENTSGALFPSIFGAYVGNVFNPKVIDDADLALWIGGNGARKDVTSTYYDVPNTIISNMILPQNEETMRKRVASVTFESTYDGINSTYDHGSHYDYDIHGNVKTMIQENVLNPVTTERFKKMEYDYDLISGKVNEFRYQPGMPDQYTHRYSYDAENRITEVQTSRDGVIWDRDAKYLYYDHGPLARVEMGQNQVQGTDYAYTLQGWVKGVNSNTLTPENDMGRDGLCSPTNPNAQFARDAYGFTLGFNNADYAGIGGADVTFEASLTGSQMLSNRNELFNGNIASTVNTITPTGTWTFNGSNNPQPMPLGSTFLYDQLNRIRNSRSYDNINVSANSWNASGAVANMYATGYTYDANGNILTLDRYDATGTNYFDKLQYGYHTEGGKLIRNRLYHVDDLAATSLTGGEDITDDPSVFNQTPNGFNTLNNYQYDEIGNLIKDTKEEIASIQWSASGKIKSITRTAGSMKSNLSFDYDASGKRVAKHEYGNPGNVWLRSVYYSRDPQGNVLAVYEHKNASPSSEYKLKERHIFGSSRVGMDISEVDMISTTSVQPQNAHYLGYKQYELNNHLNNVQEVVTDYKIPVDVADYDSDDDGVNDGCSQVGAMQDQVADYYIADILSAQDYYPFGMVMPGRTFTSNSYRYGYNGQEKDDEIKGEGKSYNIQARIYDPRLGRWLSVDPKAFKFPKSSPFNAMGNSPLYYIDPDGQENIPALLWAMNNMANKGIPFEIWYGSTEGGWVYKPGIVPTKTVCYESCWTSYMNGADATTLKLLKTGFSTKSGGFKGRSTETGGLNWFKNGDGTDRKLEKDISKGELGDIVFMGETGDMQGHAVLLAGEVTLGTIERDGVTIETATFYTMSTSSETDPGNYGGREFTFEKQSDGSWVQQNGHYKFNGFGQMKNVTATEEQRTEAKTKVEEMKNPPATTPTEGEE